MTRIFYNHKQIQKPRLCVCVRERERERGEGEPPNHLTPNPMVAQQASTLGYA